jgi:membrane fusion protein (multidrug efflux system)
MARRRRTRLVLSGVVVALAVAGYFVWQYYSIRESTDDAQVDGHVTPISARVGGTVIAVNVDDNQYVKADSVLVRIDPRDYQVALQRAQADVASARATAVAAQTGVPITSTTTASRLAIAQANVEAARAALTAAQKEVDVARAQLSSAQARLREAQAKNVWAQGDLERMKQLVVKDEISRQQYDAALAAADQARAAVDSAQAAVAQAEQGVPVAESHVVQARAALAQAQAGLQAAQIGPQEVAVTRAQFGSAHAKIDQYQATLAQAQLNLDYTTVRAPVDGVVSKKSVEPGQFVQPGQPLLAIVPLEDIWVTANFKETELNRMRPGQPARISVDAYGGRTYNGHVDSIAAATGARFSLLPPENASGNYVKVVQRIPVKILLDKGQDPQHLLRPGMSVYATVFTR